MSRYDGHKVLSQRMKAHLERRKMNARKARGAKHSTAAEQAVARDEISDYLVRVPRPPTYVD